MRAKRRRNSASCRAASRPIPRNSCMSLPIKAWRSPDEDALARAAVFDAGARRLRRLLRERDTRAAGLRLAAAAPADADRGDESRGHAARAAAGVWARARQRSHRAVALGPAL